MSVIYTLFWDIFSTISHYNFVNSERLVYISTFYHHRKLHLVTRSTGENFYARDPLLFLYLKREINTADLITPCCVQHRVRIKQYLISKVCCTKRWHFDNIYNYPKREKNWLVTIKCDPSVSVYLKPFSKLNTNIQSVTLMIIIFSKRLKWYVIILQYNIFTW